MAFTTSLLSGLTLTSTIFYFTLLYHQRSRDQQSTILRASALQLNTLADPKLASEIATIEDQNYSGGFREGVKDYRLIRKTGLERFKDGWNRELESGVRWFHQLDLNRTREGLEDRFQEWKGDQRRL